ncbi:MAG: glutamine amidotransferase [Candidatus Beckwithbacteria bacterium]|nr:glutamine amidotransferase [Patescibacteria group bacterium]
MNLNLAYLYPNQMNIYGDKGNIDALIYRSKQRNIKINLIKINQGSRLNQGSFDLLFAGGGQDQQQQLITPDLYQKKSVLIKAAQAGIPMLTICGSYQLFGAYFKPFQSPKLKGLNIFNAYTKATKKRKIGNIVVRTKFLTPKTLVGFENHSGSTFLKGDTKALGSVQIGHGNNDQDKTEGAIINNVFGCYLHGSLLPKNPHFADHLIKLALENKYGNINLKPLDDTIEWQAHRSTVKIANKPGWWNW